MADLRDEVEKKIAKIIYDLPGDDCVAGLEGVSQATISLLKMLFKLDDGHGFVLLSLHLIDLREAFSERFDMICGQLPNFVKGDHHAG